MLQLEDERLTPSELVQLNQRLGTSAPEAASIDEIAEAAGVRVDQVREHLRQLRAERAFSRARTRRKPQIGLFILALAMFAVAAKIWQVRQPPDLDAKILEVQRALAERRAKRALLNPPPEVAIPKNAPRLPSGFRVDMQAKYKKLSWIEPSAAFLPTASSAQPKLEESLYYLIRLLYEAQKNRGPHAKPIEIKQDDYRNGWLRSNPDVAIIYVGSPAGGGQSVVRLLAKEGENESTLEREWRLAASTLARDTIRSILTTQQAMTKADNRRLLGRGFPPPGYQITVTGRTTVSMGGVKIALAPFRNPWTESVLRSAVLEQLDMSVRPPTYSPIIQQGAKVQPPPAFTRVTITGPIEVLEFEVPTGLSEKYPTMSDAIRGAEAIVTAKAKEAAAQLTKLGGPASDGGP